MEEVMRAACGVLALSWTGRPDDPRATDGQGVLTDPVVPTIMAAAESTDGRVKVAFHLEPYAGRTAASVRRDLEYIVERYAGSPAFHRDASGRPWYYVYDAYLLPADQWARLLCSGTTETVRGTPLDGMFISLYLSQSDRKFVKGGCFDGIYTYFASTGFTQGATPARWNALVAWAHSENLLVSLSVGPGYSDERIRPWNAQNTKPRRDGAYYREMWEAAIAAKPDVVSVTSWNEYGEGTQIEPVAADRSVARSVQGHGPYRYLDYQPHDPFYYVDLTGEYANRFAQAHRSVASQSPFVP